MTLKQPDRIHLFPLIGLIQGLVIYVLTQNSEHWPVTIAAPLFCLSIVLPFSFYYTYQELKRANPFWVTLIASALSASLVWWAAFSWEAADSKIYNLSVSAMIMILVFVPTLIALAYARAETAKDAGEARFSSLYVATWNMFLIAVMSALFLGIVWLLLFFIWQLFGLIGISFIEDLFDKDYVATPFSFAVLGLGAAVVLHFESTALSVRHLIFGLFRLLAPVVATVMVLFLFALPFTGLEPLLNRASPTVTLVVMVVFAIGLIVSALEEGGQEAYGPALQRLMGLFLLSLPVFAGVAVYCVWVRIDAYGLTPDRVYAFAIAAFTCLVGLVYALDALTGQRAWGAKVSAANKVLPAILAVLAILLQTPVLDPYRLSANNQYNRLMSGAALPEDFDFAALKFHMGRPGAQVLEKIAKDKKFAAHEDVQARLKEVENATSYYDWERLHAPERYDYRPVDWTAHVSIWPKGAALPDGFEEYFKSRGRAFGSGCFREENFKCGLWVGSILNNGRQQVLFVEYNTTSLRMTFYAYDNTADTGWHEFYDEAYVRNNQADTDAVWQAFEEGTIMLVPPTHNNLQVTEGLTLFGADQPSWSFTPQERLRPIPAEGLHRPAAKPVPEPIRR